MPVSDRMSKTNGPTSGTARQRREERRSPSAGSGAPATPMARPRRKLGTSQAERPPVISRQTAGGMATPRSKTGKRSLADSVSTDSWVGRRYDIALSVTGAEMRLPAFPIIRGDWRFLSGAMVFIFALMVYFFIFSPVLQVEVVDYRGLERLSPADINLVVDVMGKPVVAVSPSRLQERILTTFPDISDAEVKVILPAKIIISVTERQPIVIWKSGSTERWIDAEGMVFPIRGSLAIETSETLTDTSKTLITLVAENLPFPPNAGADIFAMEDNNQEENSLLAAAAALTLNGPRQIDPALIDSILKLNTFLPVNTELVYTEPHGLGWRDPDGWDVYFGKSFEDNAAEELDQKQLVYKEIIKYLAANGIKPALVSVENVHAPYYRMER